jgi:hypothetical protein
MADTDTTLPFGVELTVKLDIGDGVIVGELGTVTLEPGDTPDKVIAEFLMNVAEEIMAQTAMAKGLIAEGLMQRVEVPAGKTPTSLTAQELDLVLGNAQNVHQGGEWIKAPNGEGVLDLAKVQLPTDAGDCCGGACRG